MKAQVLVTLDVVENLPQQRIELAIGSVVHALFTASNLGTVISAKATRQCDVPGWDVPPGFPEESMVWRFQIETIRDREGCFSRVADTPWPAQPFIADRAVDSARQLANALAAGNNARVVEFNTSQESKMKFDCLLERL